ncbi:hypothetical protein FRIG_15800 [Frigoribacterium faeni]|uniref:hypothetical protein n=1 Tax=Frigoribacterium faeni TaxID=145483 RepID=UPI001FAE3961|nr:hypothetical protein [Frigoribacterium faeni]MCJ0702574.1 hypothetical protein [Frigoribacterium faeni]
MYKRQVRERVRAEAARAVTLQRQLDEQREAAERQARRTVIRQGQICLLYTSDAADDGSLVEI